MSYLNAAALIIPAGINFKWHTIYSANPLDFLPLARYDIGVGWVIRPVGKSVGCTFFYLPLFFLPIKQWCGAGFPPAKNSKGEWIMGRRKHSEQVDGDVAVQDDWTNESGDVATANGDGPAKPVESKRERFLRLADQRLPKALKRIEQIANLGNRAQYEYTAENAEEIVQILSEAVVAVRNAFVRREEKITGFRLSDRSPATGQASF